MKVLKKILLGLLTLILLFVVVGFLMPGNIETEQMIRIKAKPDIVFAHVNSLRNWNHWAKWNQIDPDMKMTFSDKTKGKDASYAWESEDPMVGAGTMTITESIPNKVIKTRMDFRDWDDASAEMLFEEVGDSLEIRWSLVSDQAGTNIIARYFNAFTKGMLNRDLMEGLTNLKNMSESQQMAMEVDIMPEMTVAYVPVKTTADQITPKLAESYGAIATHIATQGAEMTMMPMALYLEYSDEAVDFEPSIAINKSIEASDIVQVKQYAAQKMAVFYHYGPYHLLAEANSAAQQTLDQMGISYQAARLEIYETDPGLEPDANKWLTKICFPID